MFDVSRVLQTAVTLHRQGQVDEARKLYEQVLEHDPRHANALNLLGLVGWQTGHFAEAVDYLRRAIAIDNTQAAYFGNLAEARRGLGQLEEAIGCYNEALRLQAGVAVVHLNLGSLLEQSGRLDEAIANFRRALELGPTNVPAGVCLAAALEYTGQLQPASECYERVLSIEPGHVQSLVGLAGIRKKQANFADAAANFESAIRLEPHRPELHFQLGNVHQLARRFTAAIACYRQALELSPDDSDTLCNLGNALREAGQLSEALARAERAAKLRPESASAQSNLGAVLQDLGRSGEARRRFERAAELEPLNPEFPFNLGTALRNVGDLTGAIREFDRALALAPDYGQALCSRGTALLSLGDFEAGWAGYEHRIGLPQFDARSFPQPRWNGEPLAGRTLLIDCEQGLGDTLQFVRYVNLVRRHAGDGKIVVAAQEPLLPLLTQSAFKRLVSWEQPLPRFDVYVPLLSLPYVFQTRVETVPRDVPYLEVDAAHVDRWRGELDRLDPARSEGLRIGIAWQGWPNFRGDCLRSIPLAQFAPLAEVPCVRLVSLQKGPGSQQLSALSGRFDVSDLGPALDAESPFIDTAAVMSHLDLIITSDTVIAHLAGALGVRVWVALSLAPDWRWMQIRDDSPWYPTMRLFRQSRFGQWSDVFERMADELRQFVPLKP